MNRHLTEQQITDWLAGEQGSDAAEHLGDCLRCAAELEQTRSALNLFRESGHRSAEYWRGQPAVRRPRGKPRLLATGAAITVAALVALILAPTLHRRVSLLQPNQAQVKREVFLRIPYVIPPAPYERTDVVHMDVPVAALIAAGFRMETAAAGESIPADVVVGQDGRPLAVGFPENNQ